jgi:hypothetical protein
MKRIDIKQSLFDKEFRRKVANSIRDAKKSIKIVTGEISAYNYFDLRNSAEEAANRGVKIEVYANGPETDIMNRLISHEIDVYIGEEDSSEHFMICDDKYVIVSKKDENRTKPTQMGNRKDFVIDDRGKVKEYIQRFNRLKRNAQKKNIQGSDPLVKALRNPLR